ncbi:Glycine/D-amino acid oxidases (deaminating) [Gordonia terrae C-6]|uniref:Glycine/D-amino acid oxidases (Deaminating) n=1 Tax=Gordonia terrae C-6 TaxID=1316928 RepID=R7YAQ1_9ACTN|nr:Glycine/D-amino acid oxidases (deaminating) [Gordonia terrae C-6]
MPRVSDVAVVGAGIIGLSAAYRLVRQDLSVTVYDVGRPGHGQSAGQSRIFRHAHDDRRLVDLAVRARRHWDVWSDEFGIPLISPDGAVMLGDAVPRRRGLLERAGVTVVPLDAQGLREVMPVLADYQGEAMLDVDGGSIDTRSAIAGLSGRLSGTFVHEEVLAAHSDGDTVTIRTPSPSGHRRRWGSMVRRWCARDAEPHRWPGASVWRSRSDWARTFGSRSRCGTATFGFRRFRTAVDTSARTLSTPRGIRTGRRMGWASPTTSTHTTTEPSTTRLGWVSSRKQPAAMWRLHCRALIPHLATSCTAG